MGTFTTKMRVWNPSDPKKMEELEVIVDTGAAFTWVSRSRLARLKIEPSRRMPFRAIDGRILERDVAFAHIASDGYNAPDLVVMAEDGEAEVMGAHSLEGLGLAADPVQRKLVPTVMLALNASSALAASA